MLVERKRLFLIFFVILEVLAGVFSLYIFRRYVLNKQRDLEGKKIVKIDKSNVVENIDEELKFYWEYHPNDEVKDEAEWIEEAVYYSINNDGFNDVHDYQVEKPANTFRIIVLGDSFTFGNYVNTQFNWTEVLEKRLNESEQCGYERVEVINLAMPGFDVQYLVRRFRDKGLRYDPDLVIYFESGTGFTRFNEIIAPKSKSCQESNPELNDYIDCLHKIEYDFILEYTFDLRLEMLLVFFEELFRYVDQDNMLFFYYDTYFNTYTHLEKDKEEQAKAIESLENQFPMGQYLPIIPYQQVDSDYKFSDGHPNKKGHEQIAEYIYNYFIQDQSLCKLQ
jgi:lysophospholipase L1-like esterase